MDITFTPIMTERLVLRRFKDTDAENFFECRSKPGFVNIRTGSSNQSKRLKDL